MIDSLIYRFMKNACSFFEVGRPFTRHEPPPYSVECEPIFYLLPLLFNLKYRVTSRDTSIISEYIYSALSSQSASMCGAIPRRLFGKHTPNQCIVMHLEILNHGLLVDYESTALTLLRALRHTRSLPTLGDLYQAQLAQTKISIPRRTSSETSRPPFSSDGRAHRHKRRVGRDSGFFRQNDVNLLIVTDLTP